MMFEKLPRHKCAGRTFSCSYGSEVGSQHWHTGRPCVAQCRLSVQECEIALKHADHGQVENPVAFMHGLPKLLSMAHLHGQYAALLVWPLRLCADWSYRCVKMVEHLSDWRNVLGAVTYAWLAAMLLLARPWEVVLEGLYGPAKVCSLHPRSLGMTLSKQCGCVLPLPHIGHAAPNVLA